MFCTCAQPFWLGTPKVEGWNLEAELLSDSRRQASKTPRAGRWCTRGWHLAMVWGDSQFPHVGSNGSNFQYRSFSSFGKWFHDMKKTCANLSHSTWILWTGIGDWKRQLTWNEIISFLDSHWPQDKTSLSHWMVLPRDRPSLARGVIGSDKSSIDIWLWKKIMLLARRIRWRRLAEPTETTQWYIGGGAARHREKPQPLVRLPGWKLSWGALSQLNHFHLGPIEWARWARPAAGRFSMRSWVNNTTSKNPRDLVRPFFFGMQHRDPGSTTTTTTRGDWQAAGGSREYGWSGRQWPRD